MCIKKPEAVSNVAIDKSLHKEKEKLAKEIKLLLLGAGESGKSTIFRQMKIIHNNGFNEEECMMYKDIIFANCVTAMKVLVNASHKFSIPLEDPENRDRAQRILNIDGEAVFQVGKLFHDQAAKDIKFLWTDPGIQATFLRKSELQLNDSAEYYFNEIDRIGSLDYVPTEQDVLRSRVKTTGIVETEFEYEKFKFRMFDVGGQRNERKKWIHCFQNCTAVIFVTSLSEYDLKCYEDETTNRMKESMLLFEEICNSMWFAKTSIILFFNKDDIFREKIKTIDLKCCFPDYAGGCSYENAKEFITKKFLLLNRRQNSKQVYTHFTCATDTGNIKNVFDCCKDIILHDSLKDSGLL